jgi:hypothetical protein
MPAAKVCARCDLIFQPGESFLNALSKTWHTHCFVCVKCQKTLGNSNSFVLDDGGNPLHEGCSGIDRDRDENDGNLVDGTDCPICHKPLGGTEPIVSLGTEGQERYHQRCFVCEKCKKTFTGTAFFMENGKPCHTECVSTEKEMAKAAVQSLSNERVCNGCGKEFSPYGSRRYVEELGHFHPECFVCTTCHKSLEGQFYVHPTTHDPACQRCAVFF